MRGQSLKADDVRRWLDYDPETGVFTWKQRPSRAVREGYTAGSVGHYGYMLIGLKGEIVMAHKLAWLIMKGEWPAGEVDHIDRNRSNNAWRNLRLCSRSENQENRRGGRGVSQYIGVSYQGGRAAPWVARIMKNRKSVWLGRFACETAAYVAYCRAKHELHIFATGDAA